MKPGGVRSTEQGRDRWHFRGRRGRNVAEGEDKGHFSNGTVQEGLFGGGRMQTCD